MSLAHLPRVRDLEALLGRERFAALEQAVRESVRENGQTGEEIRGVLEWRVVDDRVVDAEVRLVRRRKLGG